MQLTLGVEKVVDGHGVSVLAERAGVVNVELEHVLAMLVRSQAHVLLAESVHLGV